MDELCFCPNPELESDFEEQLLCEGFIMKQSRHLGQWRKRWAVLTTGSFCTFANRDEAHGGLPTESVLLRDLERVDLDSHSTLLLQTKDRGLSLRFEDERCKNAWVHLLRRCALGDVAYNIPIAMEHN
mmetsp:Transcript_116796/g.183665  ORF Transcript_116796/g.183665 Transcript_116796/m.183665 type:complete len:128 (-) Transcript_116796:223-606(-)